MLINPTMKIEYSMKEMKTHRRLTQEKLSEKLSKPSNTLKSNLKKADLKEEIVKQRKSKIINFTNDSTKKETKDDIIINDIQDETSNLQNKLLPLSPKYKKVIILYFLIGFIFLGINWYMMTSFCAVYRNSGVKLIVNSIVSLIASFALPCLLGLIPTLIGFLAKKLNSRIIFKVYKFINKVI